MLAALVAAPWPLGGAARSRALRARAPSSSSRRPLSAAVRHGRRAASRVRLGGSLRRSARPGPGCRRSPAAAPAGPRRSTRCWCWRPSRPCSCSGAAAPRIRARPTARPSRCSRSRPPRRCSGSCSRASRRGRIYGRASAVVTAPFGSFVNHNHFAGLTEMGAVLAAGLAASRIRRDGPSPAGDRARRPDAAAGARAPRERQPRRRPGARRRLRAARRRPAARPPRRARRPPAWTLAAALVAAAAVSARDPAAARPARAWRASSPGRTDGSAGYRVEAARATLRLLAAHPVAGAGLGAYADAVPAWKRAHGEVRLTHAESDALEFAAETGAVGLGAPRAVRARLGQGLRDRLQRRPRPAPARPRDRLRLRGRSAARPRALRLRPAAAGARARVRDAARRRRRAAARTPRARPRAARFAWRRALALAGLAALAPAGARAGAVRLDAARREARSARRARRRSRRCSRASVPARGLARAGPGDPRAHVARGRAARRAPRAGGRGPRARAARCVPRGPRRGAISPGCGSRRATRTRRAPRSRPRAASTPRTCRSACRAPTSSTVWTDRGRPCSSSGGCAPPIPAGIRTRRTVARYDSPGIPRCWHCSRGPELIEGSGSFADDREECYPVKQVSTALQA